MAKLKQYDIGCGGLPTLDVGQLRHFITIQQQAPSSPPAFDMSGQVTEWTTFATCMVSIQAMRGSDVIRGGLTTSQLYLTIATWWIPGLLPNMRVVRGDSIYVIQSVENVLEMDTVAVMNCVALGANI